MKIALVYVVFASREEAKQIAANLLKARQAACVNILGDTESIYEWDGKIIQTNECAALVKTADDLSGAVIESIRSQHSYECPCIIKLDTSQGNELFLRWVYSQVVHP